MARSKPVNCSNPTVNRNDSYPGFESQHPLLETRGKYHDLVFVHSPHFFGQRKLLELWRLIQFIIRNFHSRLIVVSCSIYRPRCWIFSINSYYQRHDPATYQAMDCELERRLGRTSHNSPGLLRSSVYRFWVVWKLKEHLFTRLTFNWIANSTAAGCPCNRIKNTRKTTSILLFFDANFGRSFDLFFVDSIWNFRPSLVFLLVKWFFWIPRPLFRQETCRYRLVSWS